MFTAALKQYATFLKRSATTLENDITQPYHKWMDILLKLTGLTLAIMGAYTLVTATNCYFVPEGAHFPRYCGSLVEQFALLKGTSSWFQIILMRWLQGAGELLIAIFVSGVLVVRHLNETLPDHIYLRCFSNESEKRRRLPLK